MGYQVEIVINKIKGEILRFVIVRKKMMVVFGAFIVGQPVGTIVIGEAQMPMAISNARTTNLNLIKYSSVPETGWGEASNYEHDMATQGFTASNFINYVNVFN